VLVAWVACGVAGALFFHAVEEPLRRWSARPQALPAPGWWWGGWLLSATVLLALD
jgi:hypothetical protein